VARIGIDARLWGSKNTGIGRYTEELVRNLQLLDKKNEYVVFCRKKDKQEIPRTHSWKIVEADIPHYSFSEQLQLVQILARENLDLLHVPHFNAPILYPRRFIITIHDILWHSSKGLKATNLPPPFYLMKYAAYKLVVRNAVSRAKAIIVPSHATAKDVTKYFSKAKNKLVVTYEGVTFLVKSQPQPKHKIKKPYILYVGNLYPHKNIEQAVKAIKITNTHLVIVCARNVFLERLEKFIKKEKLEEWVTTVGFVSDQKLKTFYANAKGFIFPTLSEGFGLPGLEAMANNCPVICSKIPVLKEVYKDAALYFDPKDTKDIAEKIQKVLTNQKLRNTLIKKGRQQVAKYSWRKMAKETLNVYEKALR